MLFYFRVYRGSTVYSAVEKKAIINVCTTAACLNFVFSFFHSTCGQIHQIFLFIVLSTFVLLTYSLDEMRLFAVTFFNRLIKFCCEFLLVGFKKKLNHLSKGAVSSLTSVSVVCVVS